MLSVTHACVVQFSYFKMSTEFRIVVPSGGQTRERAREEGAGYAKGTGSFEA